MSHHMAVGGERDTTLRRLSEWFAVAAAGGGDPDGGGDDDGGGLATEGDEADRVLFGVQEGLRFLDARVAAGEATARELRDAIGRLRALFEKMRWVPLADTPSAPSLSHKAQPCPEHYPRVLRLPPVSSVCTCVCRTGGGWRLRHLSCAVCLCVHDRPAPPVFRLRARAAQAGRPHHCSGRLRRHLCA
jgi:hypothetical protein